MIKENIIYKKMGKHRKKCVGCGKLIQDGEKVDMKKIIKEGYYPVKGIMKFVKYYFKHSSCDME